MNELIDNGVMMDDYNVMHQQRTATTSNSSGLGNKRDQRPELRVELLAATQTKDEVEGALLLDVIIRESTAVLELLACKDQALLIRRDSLLVLNL